MKIGDRVHLIYHPFVVGTVVDFYLKGGGALAQVKLDTPLPSDTPLDIVPPLDSNELFTRALNHWVIMATTPFKRKVRRKMSEEDALKIMMLEQCLGVKAEIL